MTDCQQVPSTAAKMVAMHLNQTLLCYGRLPTSTINRKTSALFFLLADPRRVPGTRPLWVHFFLFSGSFFWKMGKIICWLLYLYSWSPSSGYLQICVGDESIGRFWGEGERTPPSSGPKFLHFQGKLGQRIGGRHLRGWHSPMVLVGSQSYSSQNGSIWFKCYWCKAFKPQATVLRSPYRWPSCKYHLPLGNPASTTRKVQWMNKYAKLAKKIEKQLWPDGEILCYCAFQNRNSFLQLLHEKVKWRSAEWVESLTVVMTRARGRCKQRISWNWNSGTCVL